MEFVLGMAVGFVVAVLFVVPLAMMEPVEWCKKTEIEPGVVMTRCEPTPEGVYFNYFKTTMEAGE